MALNKQHSFTKIVHKKPAPIIDPKQPALSAAGKTILITAGHSGIGYAIAQSFVEAGAAHLILLGRRTEVLETSAKQLSAGGSKTEVHILPVSLNDQVRVHEAIAKVKSTISPTLDILVLSATYVSPAAKTIALPAQELRNSVETNLFGNANLVREFLGGPDESAFNGENKVIINLSSAAAHRVLPHIQQSAYSVSKLIFSQWLAQLHGDTKDTTDLRIYNLHPGSVLTEPARKLGFDENTLDWDDVLLPAHFVVWLASPEAKFLNGRFLWAAMDVAELKAREVEIMSNPNLLTIGLVGKDFS